MSVFLTDFGDSAVLIPASALLLAYLIYMRSARAAAIWLSTLLLCAGLTVALKIGFHACGAELPVLRMRSPSGHTSFSLTFYACASMMVAVDKERWVRVVLLLGSALLILAIALSRVVLAMHSVAEVITGALVGICCVAWFARSYFSDRPIPVRWELLGIVPLFFLLAHGRHLDFEGVIARIAALFRSAIPACS